MGEMEQRDIEILEKYVLANDKWEVIGEIPPSLGLRPMLSAVELMKSGEYNSKELKDFIKLTRKLDKEEGKVLELRNLLLKIDEGGNNREGLLQQLIKN